MTPTWFAKNADPITPEQWAAFRLDESYWRIGADSVGDYWVSTVWLGVDHGRPWDDARPVIFETMVFHGETSDDQYLARYVTEDAARAGHADITAMVRLLENAAPAETHPDGR